MKRVGLLSSFENNERGLFELHRAQAFFIPFENLSVQLEAPILLDAESLAEKLVQQKRGG